MCMMCEEEAIYAAYLEWKAQKEREEAAAVGKAPPPAGDAQPEPDHPKPLFTCD